MDLIYDICCVEEINDTRIVSNARLGSNRFYENCIYYRDIAFNEIEACENVLYVSDDMNFTNINYNRYLLYLSCAYHIINSNLTFLIYLYASTHVSKAITYNTLIWYNLPYIHYMGPVNDLIIKLNNGILQYLYVNFNGKVMNYEHLSLHIITNESN
jgi:hypothetical protein